MSSLINTKNRTTRKNYASCSRTGREKLIDAIVTNRMHGEIFFFFSISINAIYRLICRGGVNNHFLIANRLQKPQTTEIGNRCQTYIPIVIHFYLNFL